MTMHTCGVRCDKHPRLCNEMWEIPECGPPWACARFGSPGHDYQECEDCKTTFDEYLDKRGYSR